MQEQGGKGALGRAMRSSRINYIVVGSVVLVMLAVFVVVLAVLTGRAGTTDRYSIVFDNVAGLKFGSQVLYEGFPVGQIEHIEPITEDGKLRFRVEASVISGWQVPADSIARISAPGLLSALVIDIRGGRSGTYLERGARIASEPGGDMLALMTSVAEEVTDLSRNRIKPLVERITAMVDGVGTVVEPAVVDVTDNLRRIVSDLAESSPAVSRDLKGFLSTLNRSSARLNELLSAENMARIEGVIGNMQTSSEGFGHLIEDMRASLDDLGKLIASLNRIADENAGAVGASMGDMRHVLESLAGRIDAIANNLEGASRNVYEFSRQIRSNPSVLLQGTKLEGASESAPGGGGGP
ncbi:MAG: MCE family protein [Proteobacteria bacterium]|nr:MCE family protein [Pseudomonadota bacterium]